MAPTLLDGDYVLTKSASTYDVGRIYLIDHSDLGLIIKRLEREAPDGRLIFAGDNPCLLYTSPSPRDGLLSRMPSSA